MAALFLELLNMSITASWIVLAVLLIRTLFRKMPKFISCLLWIPVGLRLILPLSIESVFSLLPSVNTIPKDLITENSFQIQSGVPVIDDPVNAYLSDRYYEGVTVPTDNGIKWMQIFSVIWLIGIVLLLGYTAYSYLRLHAKVKCSIRLQKNIYLCDGIDTPFILGILAPKIYLPSHLSTEQTEYILAHENAHIKRKDHLIKPFGFLLLSVYWFNPILWLAYILLCRDIELACDEKVIAPMDIVHKKAYSSTLLDCSVKHHMIAACPLAFGEVGVKQRIRSVLNYKKPAFWVTVIAVILSLVVSLCFLTDPVTVGDHFKLTDSSGPANTNRLTYEMHLGTEVKSGEIYIESWINGTCVKSAPVLMTKYVDSVTIRMKDRRENGSSVGTEIQVETNQYGGSLLTYCAHPQKLDVVGRGFTGYETGRKVKISPKEEVILAAVAFDCGNGVRVYDCETLVDQPDRLKNAEYMIVIRAVFSDEPIEPTEESEVSPPTEINYNVLSQLAEADSDIDGDDTKEHCVVYLKPSPSSAYHEVTFSVEKPIPDSDIREVAYQSLLKVPSTNITLEADDNNLHMYVWDRENDVPFNIYQVCLDEDELIFYEVSYTPLAK